MLYDDDGNRIPKDGIDAAARDGYVDLFTRLSTTAQRTVLLRDVPKSEDLPDECLTKKGNDLGDCLFTPLPASVVDANLSEQAADETGTDVVDPTKWLCWEGECPAVIGDVLPYRDRGHLTTVYAASLSDELIRGARALLIASGPDSPRRFRRDTPESSSRTSGTIGPCWGTWPSTCRAPTARPRCTPSRRTTAVPRASTSSRAATGRPSPAGLPAAAAERGNGLTVTGGPTLVPYDGSCAALVVGWCADSPFSREWVPAAAADPDAVLAGWHTDPDITGYLLLRDGHPVAYGELWVEADDDEAELAHLVVDPALRRRGLGQALAVEAHRRRPRSGTCARVPPGPPRQPRRDRHLRHRRLRPGDGRGGGGVQRRPARGVPVDAALEPT